MLSRNKASNAARDADQLRGDCRYLFGRIAAKDRAPRVHVVGATQRPSAKVLDGDAKFNLQLRIGMGNLDPIASRIVFTNAAIADDHDLDESDGGAAVRGRGIVAPGSQLIDAQMYWITSTTPTAPCPPTSRSSTSTAPTRRRTRSSSSCRAAT